MQADAIAPGQTVVIVDDVIATGAHIRLLLDTMTGLTRKHQLLLHVPCLQVDQLQPPVNS